MNSNEYDVLILGGGLAGLTTALGLQSLNLRVGLVEKNTYPHHKVCGEYVSNEVLPYLKTLGINPFEEGACAISKFKITTNNGAEIETNLPLGGFGISRYALDFALYKKANSKTEFIFENVVDVQQTAKTTLVKTQEGSQLQAKIVVGAFGKRSLMDKTLKRSFIEKKSSWLAVKAHYEYDFDDQLVALHNFNGGYCGLSKVETGAVNACYLTTYKSFKPSKNIETFQDNVLSKNPHLHHFFKNARLLFEAPLTISQVSFEPKTLIENNIFMVGDSAGLIHPLCGNGMAMAIHSAKLFTEAYKKWHGDTAAFQKISDEYKSTWQANFSKRLRAGRTIQRGLMNPTATRLGYSFAKTFPSIVPGIIKQTHGNPL